MASSATVSICFPVGLVCELLLCVCSRNIWKNNLKGKDTFWLTFSDHGHLASCTWAELMVVGMGWEGFFTCKQRMRKGLETRCNLQRNTSSDMVPPARLPLPGQHHQLDKQHSTQGPVGVTPYSHHNCYLSHFHVCLVF